MIELNGEPFGPMHQTFGGDTLNAAVYLSRSARKNPDIHFVSAMGTDNLSSGMLQRWQEENINTSLVLRDSHRTPGLYLIQVDQQGERTFLYWRNQSAARYLLQHPEFASVKTALAKMDIVMVSGISLAILPEGDRMSMVNLLAELSGAGVRIAFDTNFRPALWPGGEQLKTVKEIYSKLFAACDYALVTFDDEQQVWGDKTPEMTLARLQKAGARNIVIKLGAEGCLVWSKDHKLHERVPTTPVANVVDTTSAGDSFNGGFLSALLEGRSLVECCQRGNALAGIVIQHRGAIVPRYATDALAL